MTNRGLWMENDMELETALQRWQTDRNAQTEAAFWSALCATPLWMLLQSGSALDAAYLDGLEGYMGVLTLKQPGEKENYAAVFSSEAGLESWLSSGGQPENMMLSDIIGILEQAGDIDGIVLNPDEQAVILTWEELLEHAQPQQGAAPWQPMTQWPIHLHFSLLSQPALEEKLIETCLSMGTVRSLHLLCVHIEDAMEIPLLAVDSDGQQTLLFGRLQRLMQEHFPEKEHVSVVHREALGDLVEEFPTLFPQH